MCLQDLGLMMSAAGKFIIAERYVWPDEYIVADAKSVPELDSALHGHTIANDDIVFDEAVRADIAVGSDFRAFQYDDVLPNARSFTDRRRLHFGKMMNLACQLPPLFRGHTTRV